MAELRTVKNPIALAAHGDGESLHVFLVGEGAERFATAMKVERVPNELLLDPAALRPVAGGAPGRGRESGRSQEDKDTVGAVALDRHGNLCGGDLDRRPRPTSAGGGSATCR